jgi:hypothetical protein
MNRRCFVAIIAFVVAAMPAVVFAQNPPSISGFVVNGRGPVAGVTVSLIHPAIGRSAPSFSAQNGYYAFFNIRPRPDPYYIEAYWGKTLIFRSQLLYRGGSIQFNIQLR